MEINGAVIFSVVRALVIVYQIIIIATAAVAVRQERKIWSHPKLPSLTIWGTMKVFLLNACWMEVCTFGSIVTILLSIITLDIKNTRRFAHAYVENYAGKFLTTVFICPTVKVVGVENLPPGDGFSISTSSSSSSKSINSQKPSPAPVYIANHTSQIDAAVCYYLNRQWRWIAKSSIIFLPGVGLTMYLGDHVMIDRVKKKDKNGNKNKSNNSKTGARNLYIKSNQSIQEGTPMMFFPQGTRQLGQRLPFKDGAFKIALENHSLLVPISIDIPLTAWNSSYPFGKAPECVQLTIHKPIKSEGKELESLKKECFDTIYSVLPDYSKVS